LSTESSATRRILGHAPKVVTYLSAILLAGLLLNALFGLWWADPAAALIMVPIIAKEGIEGLQGKACEAA
jgi:divalent metal cation (Fe/Co/Zn/Cd) transporter